MSHPGLEKLYINKSCRGVCLWGTSETCMPAQTYQRCLPLTDVHYALNRKGAPRPIPPIVEELLEISSTSPSGLVWKVASKNGKAKIGEPAGSRSGAKWLVSVRGHGLFYAHRIAYYLKTGQNPGSMVVRHIGKEELALGWQDDNGRDESGVAKSRRNKDCVSPQEQTVRIAASRVLRSKRPVVGHVTKTMYLYQGVLYNAKSLCKELGLNYSTIYQRVYRCKHTGVYAFAMEGIEVEEFTVW